MTKTTKAYIVPSDLHSSDPTVTLPLEIHHVGDGNWYAVYDGHEDVEYADLMELAVAHSIDVDHDTLAGWWQYAYQRSIGE